MEISQALKGIEEEDSELKHEIARSNYGGMLHDKERNSCYRRAIEKTIKKMISKNLDVIGLDIGTGTGLLAMMAARGGAKHVVACESFQPMAEVASCITAANGLQDIIEIVNKCSYDLEVKQDISIQRKPNLLITEIFDTELLGEGVLPTLRHAHKELLEDNCFTVPYGAEVKIQLISSDFLWRSHKLEEPILKMTPELLTCRGTASPYEVHIDAIADLVFRSDSVSIVRFDFAEPFFHTHKDMRKSPFSCSRHDVKITSEGSVHAILFWWKLFLDSDESITLEMNPKYQSASDENVTWRDHWMQAVYFLSQPLNCKVGDIVPISCQFDDYTFWFDVKRNLEEKDHCWTVERPLCTCSLHLRCSRERFRQLNDNILKKNYQRVIDKISGKGKSCVCIGESSLLPLLLVNSGFKQVTYIDCSPREKSLLRKVAPELSKNEIFEEIKCSGLISIEKLETLFLKYTFNVIVIDPFLSSNLLPWHSLTIWILLWSLKLKNRCSLPEVIIPNKAVLKAIAVEFADLWKARASVGAAEGFDLSPFDTLMQDAYSPQETRFGPLSEADPFPVWEYESSCRSQCFTLMEFDVRSPIVEETICQGTHKYNSKGYSDAIVLWMEFFYNDNIICTTGLQTLEDSSRQWIAHSQQGIYFFKDRRKVTEYSELPFNVYFNPTNGDMMFRF